MPQLEPWVVTLGISIAVVGATRVIDWAIDRQKARNAAVAAGRGPTIPTSWEEAYEDLSEKYLRLQSEVMDLKDQLAARDQAIRKQSYETAQAIYTDVNEIYKRLNSRRTGP